MNSDNIQDLLLQAMEIISNSVVKENDNKDITIWNCYITDDSNRKNGEYKVSDGSIDFKAYSQYTEYKKSDYVAVVVPQGDYNNTKYIVQKVAANGSQLPYASPLDNYVQVTENLLTNFKTQVFDKTQKQVHIDTLSLNTYGTPKGADKKNIYDTLIFSCEFKTYLSNSKKIKGKYGLIFTLNYKNEIGYPLQETITFDSTQFYGNPFNFVLPSKQSQGFALSETNSLTSISIDFFQDLTLDNSLSEVIPIIELLDLNIGLGINVVKQPDNTLKIYTTNGFDYNKDNCNKSIGLFWYNKDENNRYIGFTDGIEDPNYSEEKYVEEKRKYELYDIIDAKDKHPLDQDGMDLAVDVARFEDVSKLMLQDFVNLKTVVDQFNKALTYPLSELYVNETGTQTGKEFMDIVCGNTSNSLEQCYSDVKTTSNEIISNFNKVLLEGKTIEKYTYDSPLQYLQGLKNILPFDENNNFISSEIAKGMSSEAYSEYYNIYREYCKKIQRYRYMLDTIYYNKMEEILGTGNNTLEKRLQNRDTRTPYQKVAFSEEPYENRYCIYWYKDSPNHEDLILGKGWEHLEKYDNKGKDNTFTYSLDALGSQQLRAVLFLNHQQYNSDILTFNLTTSDGSIIDPNAALSIKHGENSLNSYQFYDDNNYIMKISDTKVKRILYPSLSSSIGQTLNDFSGGKIYWFLPKSKTMLKYIGKFNDKGKYEDENGYDMIEEAENYCFYKVLPLSDSLSLEDFDFAYLIDEYYDKYYSNNTIQCKIIKEFQEYEASIPITFSSLGKNDSEYSLVVTPHKNSGRALTEERGDIVLQVRLFDSKDNEIPLYYSNLISSLPSVYGLLISRPEVFNGTMKTSLGIQDSIPNIQIRNMEEDTYGILHLEADIYVNKTKTITIKKDYSIPFTTIKNSYVDGMFSIIYSCFGNNPRYYKDPFKFYNGTTDKEEEVTWSISVIPSDNEEQVPEFRDNILVPKNSWIKTYKDEEKTEEALTQIVAQAKLGKETVWYQPIIIDSEVQSYRLFEGWNGKFQINEQGGYILSNMLVAGTKDEKNNFTGVTLGNMEILEQDFAEVKEESESNTPAMQEESQSEPILKSGMFGFHKGESSFGFETDGTAFIGKNGKGRIKFDGNRGIIDMGTVKINSQPDEKSDDGTTEEESYFQISKKIKKQKEDYSEEEVDAMIFQVSPSKAQIGDENLDGAVLRINMAANIESSEESDNGTETNVLMDDYSYLHYNFFDKDGNTLEAESQGNRKVSLNDGYYANSFYLGKAGCAFYYHKDRIEYWSKLAPNGLFLQKLGNDNSNKVKTYYQATGITFYAKNLGTNNDFIEKGKIYFNYKFEEQKPISTLTFKNFDKIKFESIDGSDDNPFIFGFDKPVTFSNDVSFAYNNAETKEDEETLQNYLVDIEGRAKFESGKITFINAHENINNIVNIENRVKFEADKITFYQTNDSVYDEEGNLSQKNILVEFNPEVQFKHKVLFGEESSDNVYPNTQITFNAQTQFDQPVIFTQESKPEFNSETSFNKKTSFKPNMLNIFGNDVEPDTDYYSKNNNNVVLFNKITAFSQQVDFFSLTDFKGYASFYNGACFEGPNGTTVAEFKGLTIFNGVTQFDNATTFNKNVTFNQDESSQITTTFNQTAKFNASVTFDDENKKGYNVIFDISTYFYGETGFSSQVYFGEKSAPIFDDKVTFKNQVDFTRSDQNSLVNFSLPVTFKGIAQFKEKIIFGDSLNSDNNSTNIIFNKASRFIQTASFENIAYFYNSTYFLKDVSFSDSTYFSNNVSFSKQVTFKREATDTASTAEFSLPANFNSSSTFKGVVKFGENAPSTNQIIFNASAVFNQSPIFNTIVDFTKNVTFSNYVTFSKLPTYSTSGAPETFATKEWVEDKGYITSTWLTEEGYVTMDQVNGQGYLTQDTANSLYLKSGSLSGYATQSWVTSQDYVTETDADNWYVFQWTYEDDIEGINTEISGINAKIQELYEKLS